MDGDLIEMIILVVVFVVAPIVQRLFKKDAPEEPWDTDFEPEPYPDAAPAPAPPMPYPGGEPPPYPDVPTRRAPAPPPPAHAHGDLWEEERAQLLGRLQDIAAEADDLAASARIERITRDFAPTLVDYVGARAKHAIYELRTSTAAPGDAVYSEVQHLDLVFGQVEMMIRQRRNKQLAPLLGDADEFASSCYQPVVDFANARGIGLTSNIPATELGPFDLSIWTGFTPTGIAPIFLPRDFFERIAWWPALAHELGHDFFRATHGLESALRQQLGMVSEYAGRRPLAFSSDGLSVHELYRVFGGWFEELFCDAFGTLMVGPAYVHTMIELFASPYDPAAIARVHLGRDGLYGEHPPRHLRFVFATEILDLLGQYDDTDDMREEWERLHGGIPDGIGFPIGGQMLGIPMEPMETITRELAQRLYSDQIAGLSEFRLPDIPGIDFGPHENAEAERVRRELLSGSVPHETNARSVIAGAVLAWHDEPDNERDFIVLARRAIDARGSFEQDVDAYRPETPDVRIGKPSGELDARDAFLLHTILSPPPSLRRLGFGAKSGGFMSRRGW